MPSITVDAPNEDIDLTICLDDYLSEIEVDLNEEQVHECIDDDPPAYLLYLYEDHKDVFRDFIKGMDAGERLQLFAHAEKEEEEEKKKDEVTA